MVYIRETLREEPIVSGPDLSTIAVKFLQKDGRYWSQYYPEAVIQWINEVPVDEICKMKGVIPGDFYKLREDLDRVLVYYGAIADFYGLDEVKEIAEELQLRVKHGIKEELLDLVVQIKGVGRIRGRILFNAGYTMPSDLASITPHELCANTNIPIHICEQIIKHMQK
jgi:helicase